MQSVNKFDAQQQRIEQNYHKLYKVLIKPYKSRPQTYFLTSPKMQPTLHPNPPLQQSLSRHKKNYQKYLNNIYETIKEKQFYIHRSKTPNMQILNIHELSKLSERGTAGNRDDGLKSLPKLTAKDTISNEVMDIVLASCDNNSKHMSKTPSPVKKGHSSSDKKSQAVVIIPPSQNSIYHFRNFPQPKPSINTHMMYGSPCLKQSKQLSKNSTISRQKMNQQSKQQKIPLSERSKRPSNQNNDHNKLSIYKKISKDNMNLLGLNVEKMNYSEKREVINSNRRQMFMRLTRAEGREGENGQQMQEIKNGENVYVATLTDNMMGDAAEENGFVMNAFRKRLTPDLNNMIDMQACEQLISQKMQFSKRNNIIPYNQSQKPQNPYSPNRQRRRISASDKKPFVPNNEQQLNPIYEARYKKYLDLMLKLSFSYKKYGEMDAQINACSHVPIKNDKKYRAWIGIGNNGNLIIALIKRRFWWQIVDEKSWGVNFLWTQLKNNQYFKAQADKAKNKNTLLSSRFSKQIEKIEKSTNMDESTCLSVDNDKSLEKPNFIKRTRAQSSLPGSLSSNRKSIVSPAKKQRQVISEEESKMLSKLLNRQQIAQYKKLVQKIQSKTFPQKLQMMQIQKFSPYECRTHNHLMNNFYLGNKKALFHNLKEYYSLTGGDLFKTVPLTFHIKKGIKDPQYKRFLAYYKKRQAYIKKQQKQMQTGVEEKRKMRNIWIVKPGENTNRGNGITVIDQIYELNSIFKSQGTHNDGSQKTFIVQLYIDRPLLYKKRKFDIRHYMTITHIHGVMKGYWFEEGYIRTSGYEFDVENFQREIHLTNDAVQKYTPNYGRFQPANKISYAEFQKYLDQTYPKKNYDFFGGILPRMKEICLDAIKSACLKLSPEKLQHNFELFGLDFMIDSDFVPWLIQINTNPCLQLTNALQSRLIPQVVDETLRLSLDVIYPPPCHYPNTYRHLVPDNSNMKAQLIFDQSLDGEEVRKLYQKRKSNEKALLEEIGQLQDDEVYEDQGQQDIKLDELLQ